MRPSVIKYRCEKSPVVSYHRKQITPASDFAKWIKIAVTWIRQIAMARYFNVQTSDEKIRTVTVPGQTLERGNGPNQVAASIKERNCDQQINKIGHDKMMACLASFLWNGHGKDNIIRLAPIVGT